MLHEGTTASVRGKSCSLRITQIKMEFLAAIHLDADVFDHQFDTQPRHALHDEESVQAAAIEDEELLHLLFPGVFGICDLGPALQHELELPLVNFLSPICNIAIIQYLLDTGDD